MINMATQLRLQVYGINMHLMLPVNREATWMMVNKFLKMHLFALRIVLKGREQPGCEILVMFYCDGFMYIYLSC